MLQVKKGNSAIPNMPQLCYMTFQNNTYIFTSVLLSCPKLRPTQISQIQSIRMYQDPTSPGPIYTITIVQNNRLYKNSQFRLSPVIGRPTKLKSCQCNIQLRKAYLLQKLCNLEKNQKHSTHSVNQDGARFPLFFLLPSS